MQASNGIFIEVIDHVVHDRNVKAVLGRRKFLQSAPLSCHLFREPESLNVPSEPFERVRATPLNFGLNPEDLLGAVQRSPNRPRPGSASDFQKSSMSYRYPLEQKLAPKPIAFTVAVTNKFCGQ